MKTLAVLSLTLLTAVGAVWYVVHSIRERRVEMGRYFGSHVSFDWPDKPVRFLFGLALYAVAAVLLGYVVVVSAGDVDPPLWALWPGILGPVAAIVLARRYYGAPVAAPVLDAFAVHVLAGELGEARKLVEERAPLGFTRRLLEAALGAAPEPAPTPDYRSSAAPRATAAMSALERAFDAERGRARLCLIPATAAVGACLVMLLWPPRADLVAVWSVLGIELAFAALTVHFERRRSRRQGEVLALLGARFRPD